MRVIIECCNCLLSGFRIDAKDVYDEIFSLHVYSLSPATLIVRKHASVLLGIKLIHITGRCIDLRPCRSSTKYRQVKELGVGCHCW